jgi:hypothetical protein
MQMNKLVFVLLLGGLAAAQTKTPEPSRRSVTYEFKNVDIGRAAEIVNFAGQLDNKVMIQLNGPFKTAIIQPNGNTPPEVMEKTLELLKRYDVAPTPPPRVEFVAYLVWASVSYSNPPGQPIPAAIEEAVAEMRKTFAYTDYKLLDTVSTDVRHHAELDNLLPGALPGKFSAGPAYSYTISYGDAAVSNDGKTVNVNPFRFSLRIPSGGTYLSTGITTDVAIHEGQKLVLGKVRIGLEDSVNIFLVLTVKVHNSPTPP